MALAVTMTETMSPSTMVKRPSMAAEMLHRFSNLRGAVRAGPADVSHSRPRGAPDADPGKLRKGAPQRSGGRRLESNLLHPHPPQRSNGLRRV